MCFFNDDYDWVAEINEREYVRKDKGGKCYECCRVIAPGEWRSEIFQQEHEECQICSEWGDQYDDTVLKETCEHCYGETFECSVCRDCCLILEAIYDLEEKEGCPEHARQPMYGELSETLQQDSHYGEGKYKKHALAMYPELTSHRLMLRAEND